MGMADFGLEWAFVSVFKSSECLALENPSAQNTNFATISRFEKNPAVSESPGYLVNSYVLTITRLQYTKLFSSGITELV